MYDIWPEKENKRRIVSDARGLQESPVIQLLIDVGQSHGEQVTNEWNNHL